MIKLSGNRIVGTSWFRTLLDNFADNLYIIYFHYLGIFWPHFEPQGKCLIQTEDSIKNRRDLSYSLDEIEPKEHFFFREFINT